MVTIMLGTGDSRLLKLVPRPILRTFIGLAIKAQAKEAKEGDVPLRDLIPTMRYEIRVIYDTAGPASRFSDIAADVLLFGGRRSAAYLRTALDALEAALPNARRVELPGVGHIAADNGGKPELVAAELRRFFEG